MAQVNAQNNIYVVNSDEEWPDQLDQYIIYNVVYDFDPVGPGWYGWDGNSLVYLGPGLGAYGGIAQDTRIGPLNLTLVPIKVASERNLPSSGLTPDFTTDDITLEFGGDYTGRVDVTYGVDKAAIIIFNLFVNGLQVGADVTIENTNQVDFLSVSFGSIVTLDAADVVDVRWSAQSGNENVTLDRYRLEVVLAGEAVVTPVP